jgi:hypothetical protein
MIASEATYPDYVRQRRGFYASPPQLARLPSQSATTTGSTAAHNKLTQFYGAVQISLGQALTRTVRPHPNFADNCLWAKLLGAQTRVLLVAPAVVC